MLKTWTGILALIALLAGCAPLSPRDREAVRIEGTPGKAVIYLVRTNPDLSTVSATVTLNGDLLGTTHAGTYFRVEVPAGRHRFSGYAGDSGSITVDVQSDRIYFIRQTVAGYERSPSSLSSFFSMIDEKRGRAALVGADRIG